MWLRMMCIMHSLMHILMTTLVHNLYRVARLFYFYVLNYAPDYLPPWATP